MNTIRNVVLYDGSNARLIAQNAGRCGFRPPVALPDF